MDTLFDTRDALRKIRKAFTMLRQEGIQAHMRYVCCMQCGQPEPPFFGSLVYVLRGDEMDFKSAGVLPVWVRGQDEDRAGARALGDQVRIALEVSGLTVEWSGDPDHAILVMA